MRIIKIECIPISVPFKRSRVTAYGEIKEKPEVVVKIYTDEGIVGIGESGEINPGFLGVGGQDSMMAIIKDFLGPILLGESPFNLETIIAKMDRVIKGNNQAKAIIDIALHDVIGQSLGIPLYKFLGGLSSEKIPLGWVLSGKSIEENVNEAVKAIEAGFKSLKLKVGVYSPDRDIQYVESIRDAVGDNIRLMIDANSAWNFHTALTTLKKLEKYDIAFAEQPLPYWDIEGLKALRAKQGIPIAADESVSDVWDVLRLIKEEAVDVLFIKVVKVGGIHKARKCVSIAMAADIPVMCGCMMGGGIEAAAQAHFIAATEWMGKMEHEINGPLETHDVFESTGIIDDIVEEVPRFEKGYAYPPSEPGLGVKLNEKVINQLVTPGKRSIVIEKR